MPIHVICLHSIVVLLWSYRVDDLVDLPGVDKGDTLWVKGVARCLHHLVGCLVLDLQKKQRSSHYAPKKIHLNIRLKEERRRRRKIEEWGESLRDIHCWRPGCCSWLAWRRECHWSSSIQWPWSFCWPPCRNSVPRQKKHSYVKKHCQEYNTKLWNQLFSKEVLIQRSTILLHSGCSWPDGPFPFPWWQQVQCWCP